MVPLVSNINIYKKSNSNYSIVLQSTCIFPRTNEIRQTFTLNATSIARTPFSQQPINGVESLWIAISVKSEASEAIGTSIESNHTQETNKLNQTKAKTEKKKNLNYANQQSTNNVQTVSIFILNSLVSSTVDTSYFINYTLYIFIMHSAPCSMR